jgi:hypothetical protein
MPLHHATTTHVNSLHVPDVLTQLHVTTMLLQLSTMVHVNMVLVQDVQTQALVTTIHWLLLTMAHVLQMTNVVFVVEQVFQVVQTLQHVTTTQTLRVMTIHANTLHAQDVLIQPLVTMMLQRPSMTVLVCNWMSAVTAVVMLLQDVPTQQLVTMTHLHHAMMVHVI